MNNFIQRALSGLVYVGLIIGAAYLGGISWIILMSLFFGFCMYEFFKMNNISKLFPFFLFTSFPILFILAFPEENIPFQTIMILSFSAWICYGTFSANKLKTIAIAGFGSIALLFPFALSLNFQGEFSWHPVLFLFIALWTNDTFAYLSGRLLGRHKLYPKLSPGKTWEGFFGGVLFAALAGYLIDLSIDQNPYYLIIFPIMGLAGTLGDLVESKLKRELELKDSSQLIPGHGGFLDRLDSFIFSMPLYFILIQLL